ncbi:hypothetical protein HYDPIDRAFT_32302 [Hydnomerulius pinastri MD-312]|uniref:Uncharacterized protein n=1 Tax=Hydnomerulius pinastri MD-312 TaxID=994086 RepID=A0A0C9V4E7_9AGAM|nr:hypothetical protein HYDPIDRAFT_32302 [Hydnomerulius pinastri MD-312]
MSLHAPTNAVIPSSKSDAGEQSPDGEESQAGHSDYELVAMKTAQHAAINSNEKIFPVFARKLASKDIKDYLGTANKLRIWLSSEKAYYPVARPKIVELLEIAHATFADEFLHNDSAINTGEVLRQLVRTVIPYMRLFPENHLQVRLQRVIQQTDDILNNLPLLRASAHAAHAHATSQLSVHAGSAPVAGPSGATTMSPLVEVGPYTQPPILPMPFSLPSLPDMSLNIKREPVDVEQHIMPQACASTSLAQHSPETKHNLSSPTTTAPPDLSTSSASVKPQPKRLRKAELSEELKARDLDWFKSKQNIALPAGEPIAMASTSQAGESSTAPLGNQPPAIVSSPSPKKKTARMVPSRFPRRVLPPEVAQEMAESTSKSTSPPLVTEPPVETSVSAGTSKDADGIKDKPSAMDIDAQNHWPVQADPPDQPVTTVGSAEAEQAPGSAQAVPLPHPNDSPKPDSPPVKSLSTEPLSTEPLSTEPPTAEPRPTSTETPLMDVDPPTTSDTTAQEPLEVADNRTELNTTLTAPEPPPTEAHTNLPSPPEQPRESPASSPNTGFSMAPVPPSLSPQIDQVSPIQALQEVPDDASGKRFGGNMVVIHCLQGKSFTHTHDIEFNLSEALFSNVSRWVSRKVDSANASQSSESHFRGAEDLTYRSSCSWPHSNRLSLQAKRNEKETIISLSPPIVLTPDQCVDISSFMAPGRNTVRIKQRGDLSEYALVFHAHHPTRAQLAELSAVKASDERWSLFLKTISSTPVSTESPWRDLGHYELDTHAVLLPDSVVDLDIR